MLHLLGDNCITTYERGHKMKKFCTRHIIPFSYKCDGGFAEICQTLEYNADWEVAADYTGEQDIYEYMNHALSPRENKGNVGRSFDYIRRDDKGRILRLLWCRKDENVEIVVKNSGLYLFRTGIGFFWNEIEVLKDDLTCDELVLLQNKFKEYNHSGNFRSFYEIISDNEASPSEEYDHCPLRRMAFIDGKEQPMYYGCRRFTMGNRVARILEDLKCDIIFYPQRKNCFSTIVDMPRDLFAPYVPDKALLFNYVVMDGKEAPGESAHSLEELAFYLTNGYKDSYQMNPEESSHMYKPFANAYWYVTKSGCGYYIQTNEKNDAFFTGTMPQKVMQDYFSLYILLLYQNYTLLKYAGEIEDILSADESDYLADDKDFSSVLEDLKTRINVFLVKSVYASVSHIQHQNGFYEYAEEMIGIKKDIESITIGLESLEELHRTKKAEQREADMRRRQNQLSLGMGALSLLAIFSAFVDSINFINTMQTFWIGKAIPQLIAYGIVLIIVLFVSVYAAARFIISLIESRNHN